MVSSSRQVIERFTIHEVVANPPPQLRLPRPVLLSESIEARSGFGDGDGDA
jgi:hypothetical protein